MNTDQILNVPDACPICGHQLAGNESICPKCGHCVICQRPQHSRSVPDSQFHQNLLSVGGSHGVGHPLCFLSLPSLELSAVDYP